MSLLILVAIVTVGIGLIVVLVHVTGGSQRPPLGDEEAVAFDPHEMTLPRLVIRFDGPATRAEVMAALGMSAIAVSKAA